MAELASLLPIIGIFLVFWLLLIRPASKRQKKMQALQRSLSVGDQVLTNSGIFGTVATLEDDKIGLEIAPGVVVRLARGAVAGIAGDQEPPAEDPEPSSGPEENPATGEDR